jgi:Lrp/AsnC family transcriptional regulator, regulator for asnA, asnC and gidA
MAKAVKAVKAESVVRRPAVRSRRAGTPKPVLDDVDRAIIVELQHDGRLPYTRLGAAVGLSEAAARQRVQRLLDTGVMQVVAVTDPLSLGMGRMAMIGVRAEGDLDAVAERLGELDDVEYLVVVAGSYDFLLEVVVEDDQALLDVMNRVRAVSGVHETETFLYLKLAKQTFAWGAH